MGDNLGRYVKWQDENQGWHTGRVIMTPMIQSMNMAGELTYFLGNRKIPLNLVQESCCGALTWVEAQLLQPWGMRSEWEDKALPFSEDHSVASPPGISVPLEQIPVLATARLDAELSSLTEEEFQRTYVNRGSDKVKTGD